MTKTITINDQLRLVFTDKEYKAAMQAYRAEMKAPDGRMAPTPDQWIAHHYWKTNGKAAPYPKLGRAEFMNLFNKKRISAWGGSNYMEHGPVEAIMKNEAGRVHEAFKMFREFAKRAGGKADYLNVAASCWRTDRETAKQMEIISADPAEYAYRKLATGFNALGMAEIYVEVDRKKGGGQNGKRFYVAWEPPAAKAA